MPLTLENPVQSLGSVLVVGGCGFLGHHIVRLINVRYKFDRLAVLDLTTSRNRVDDSNITYFDGDITDAAQVATVLKKFRADVVIHTASPAAFSLSTAKQSATNALFQKVNVEGTRTLVEESKKAGVKAFVYTSTASVVSDNTGTMDLLSATEEYPLCVGKFQTEFYTQTKIDGEKLVLASNRSRTDLKNPFLTVSLRPAGLFGEGDVQMVPIILNAYYNKQTKWQLGDNNNLFDTTYVENAAYAHILACISLLNSHLVLVQKAASAAPELDDAIEGEDRVDGEAFFITNGTPVYFWDFARSIWAEAGDTTDPQKDVRTIEKNIGLFLASMLGWIYFFLQFFGMKKPSLGHREVKFSCMTRYFNIGKARRRLGYAPKVTLAEGVRRSVKFVLEQRKQEAEKKDK